MPLGRLADPNQVGVSSRQMQQNSTINGSGVAPRRVRAGGRRGRAADSTPGQLDVECAHTKSDTAQSIITTTAPTPAEKGGLSHQNPRHCSFTVDGAIAAAPSADEGAAVDRTKDLLDGVREGAGRFGLSPCGAGDSGANRQGNASEEHPQVEQQEAIEAEGCEAERDENQR